MADTTNDLFLQHLEDTTHKLNDELYRELQGLLRQVLSMQESVAAGMHVNGLLDVGGINRKLTLRREIYSLKRMYKHIEKEGE